MNELKRQKIKSIVEQTVDPTPLPSHRWRYVAAGFAVLAFAIGIVALLR